MSIRPPEDEQRFLQEPTPHSDDVVLHLGPINLTRRELLVMVATAAAVALVDTGLNWLNSLRGRPASTEIPQNEVVRGNFLAFYDQTGQKIDPNKGFSGNIFYYLVSQEPANGVTIGAVESTVGAFTDEVSDDTDNAGGWPITGKQTQPAAIIGNKRIYGFVVNMDNLNGNDQNKIHPGGKFEISVNVFGTLVNGADFKRDGEPGPLHVTRI